VTATAFQCALPWCRNPSSGICADCAQRIREIRAELCLRPDELLPVDLLEHFWEPPFERELGVKQAARLLGVHPNTVNHHCRRGTYRAVKRGGHHYLSAAEVIRIRQIRSYLTVPEAATRLGLSAEYLGVLIRQGELEPANLRARQGGYLIDPAEVERYAKLRERRRQGPPETLSVREFAAAVRHPPSTVSGWCRSGKLSARRDQRGWHIPVSELERYRSLVHLRTAAYRSGVPYHSLRNLADSGRLPHQHWGKLICLEPGVVERLIWEKENLISSRELARRVGLGSDAVLRLGREGRIPVVRESYLGWGQFLRVTVEPLREWLEWERANLISCRELASLTGLSDGMVYRLGVSGKLETIQHPFLPDIGHHLRSSVERLNRMLERGEIKPGPRRLSRTAA
jgi:excisionase family DNA binding protein